MLVTAQETNVAMPKMEVVTERLLHEECKLNHLEKTVEKLYDGLRHGYCSS
jgi:hypothetical protein